MDPENTSAKQKNPPVNLIALGAAVLLAVGAVVFINSTRLKIPDAPTTPQSQNQAPADKQTTGTPSGEQAMKKEGEAMMAKYKDGTYTSVGNYTSPAGPEEIEISLTLEKGVITEAVATPKATNPKSVNFQGIFTENFKPLVVGKSIGEVKLDKVAGSSLTPGGFNDAVVKIMEQAKG